jgi:hypothetical protein
MAKYRLAVKEVTTRTFVREVECASDAEAIRVWLDAVEYQKSQDTLWIWPWSEQPTTCHVSGRVEQPMTDGTVRIFDDIQLSKA